MMGTGSRKRAKETAEIIRTASPELIGSAAFQRQLLMHLAEYRTELPVREVMVFSDGYAYYVCPRCRITLEREFAAYCDRCGQRLGWKDYKKARVIYPDKRKEMHT